MHPHIVFMVVLSTKWIFHSNFSYHVFDLLVFHCYLPCPCKPHLLLCESKREGWRLGRWVQECIFSVGIAKSQITRRYDFLHGKEIVICNLFTYYSNTHLTVLTANQVHPKNWYPIPLILCRPWGKLPENVPCHPKLADFANCMKKKGRGMSIFVSTIDGDYHELAEDAKTACHQLEAYIEYKQCEGVAEIIVAPSMSEGFRSIVQTMGLGNLKPNIVVVRYPEIWRRENLTEIPSTFVSIINDCIIANKAVVIVKGLDEWPNEFQRQYGTIDLYWIVRDGGLMLLLSQLLLTKATFESCKIQVFCIAEEDTDAAELKTDVKKFLYDLRMHAEVIVVTMKSWESHVENSSSSAQPDDSQEAYTSARRRISAYLSEMKETTEREGRPQMVDGKQAVVNEEKVDKFLYTMFKLNSTILRHSRMAAVVLVSLPPPPLNHPAYFYMEYMDMLVENVPRMLIVRGYRRDVVTFFT
uniref:SLC12A transporter C-terminal domain-containing protein n=1 Tax=Aegilops tauschii subsp. strangulata TaxID=200361 RepID=A0A453LNB9_AEGTS